MDIELIKQERDKYKKHLKTFIVLEIISVVLLILVIFTFVSIAMIASIYADTLETYIQLNENQLAALIIFGFLSFYYSLITLAMAADAFVPFIIINAIKLGKRNNIIDNFEKRSN